MRVLVLYSGGPIFASLAERLYRRLDETPHQVDILREECAPSVLRVFKARFAKSGPIRGASEILFKAFDLLFMRRRLRHRANQNLTIARVATICCINSSEARKTLRTNEYDVVICLATSIVGKKALHIPRLGFVNIHPGVLPQYRGIGNFWAVTREDFNHVGVTIHWMTEKIDAGEIIAIGKLDGPFLNLWDINYRSLTLGVDLLAEILTKKQQLERDYEYASESGQYYSWPSLADYRCFRRSLRGQRSTCT